jgi:hypothetical protein
LRADKVGLVSVAAMVQAASDEAGLVLVLVLMSMLMLEQ